MKAFSKHWKSSKSPKKQRKYRLNLPLHQRKKLLSATLSKELRTKYKTRNIPIRKGDKVKVMRGSNKGKTGEVIRVDKKKVKVFVQGVERTKPDGSKTYLPIDPSNLMITELKLDDKYRIKILERNKDGTH
jgi:large subunit ribosomal protein L24